MSKRLLFFGRYKEVQQLQALYELRRHVLIVGSAGIGKTALLQHVRHSSPMLICNDSSSLRRICSDLERELGWAHHKFNVIERKNRLLVGLERRSQPLAFDHVIHTAPRVARFMAHVAEKIPVWIAARSDQPHHVGHIWPELYKFTRIEISALTETETLMLIDDAVGQGRIQPNARAHAGELQRISGGSPQILTELLAQLAVREYKIDSLSGLHLVDVDRRIRQIHLAIKSTVQVQR